MSGGRPRGHHGDPVHETPEAPAPHPLRLHLAAPEEAVGPHVPGHVAHPERHHARGTFLLPGQTVPTEGGGAILAHGTDRAGIERIAAEDPFVAHGVAEYVITSLAPGRVRPALAPLLTEDG
ncbi:YciI family protein [Streptomyces sp. SCA2-2]|uniref:YciI family protein n=1 Tax=Streptomyces sp. SCA2-2 TaxID=1563677 RepID=UPI001F5D5C3F|nr:YciI family protein [Streptomyces sp. SCA2-2]